MKVRYGLCCITLLIAVVFQANNTLLAQDVAAAARANRASHNNAASVKADSEWYGPTRASIRAQDQGAAVTIVFVRPSASTTTARWYHSSEWDGNQDLKITMDTVEKGKKQIAEMMVINGQSQWMLVKNIPLEKGYEIDALDGVVLNLKLALELLRAAAPGGPTGIKQKTTFDVKEDRRSIAVNTASASGGLEAPWTLHAIIEPSSADQWSFELLAKHERTIHINGTWQKQAALPSLDDDLSLDGWQILGIGPIKTTDGNSTILDYGAQISEKHPKTLGELRKTAAR
jgi:hypothetical protein